jgi:hypothetical protein
MLWLLAAASKKSTAFGSNINSAHNSAAYDGDRSAGAVGGAREQHNSGYQCCGNNASKW